MIKLLNSPSLHSALCDTIDICKEKINREIEIVVPDKLSLYMEKFLFEQLNICASFNISVSTFNRFAKRSIDVDKEKQITKTGSIILINKILNDKIDEFEVLKSANYSFSYAENIYNTIMQLKSSKIHFDEMLKFNSEDKLLTSKIHDLAKVYVSYETEKSGLLDSSDMFLMSAQFVAKDNKNKIIIFVGFDDFTAIEYTIISQLSLDNEIVISNYFSEADNSHIYNKEVYEHFKSIANSLEIPFVFEKPKQNKSNLNSFLENNLFATNQKSYTLNSEILKIYSANSLAEEIEFVARDIRAKVLKGYKYGSFGVAIFGLEGKENILNTIFSKYNLNYYIDSNFLLSESVMYKFIVSLFKYNLEGYSLCHLIDLINSPFVLLSQDDKQKLTDRLLVLNYNGNFEKINILGENFDEIKQNLCKFLEIFKFNRNNTIEEFIEILKNADNKLNFDELLNDISQNCIKIEEQLLLVKSKQLIFETLEEIKKFYPNVNMEKVFDIFVHIASHIKINNLPLTIDAIKIVNAEDNMEIFDNYYLINCNSNNAPSLKNDCGIILDKEIEKLSFKNKLSPTIAHINRLSKLRLFNSCLMFNKSLTISYTNIQSELIKELQKRIKLNVDNVQIDLPIFNKFNFGKYEILSENDALEFFSKNTKIFKNLIKNDEKSLKYMKNNENLNKILMNINKFNDYISKNNLKIYDNFDTISASKLEDFFACPLYSFLKNSLKINNRLTSEIMSFDVGNILHEIIYDYYKQNKNVGDIYLYSKNKVFEIVGKLERLKFNAESPIIKNLIDETARVLNGLNYIDENSAFKPYKFEYAFFNENALKLKNINIVGKVDRVDIFEDKIRIVDYKSGKADANLTELYYGNKLQLFLYSVAMENKLNLHSIGSFYLPLHNKFSSETSNTYSLKGFYENTEQVVPYFDTRLSVGEKSDIVNVTLTKENISRKTVGYKELELSEMQALKDYSQAVSEKAVEEIKSGYIKPSPSGNKKPCEYCPYVHMCLPSSNNIKSRQTLKVDKNSFKERE